MISVPSGMKTSGGSGLLWNWLCWWVKLDWGREQRREVEIDHERNTEATQRNWKIDKVSFTEMKDPFLANPEHSQCMI